MSYILIVPKVECNAVLKAQLLRVDALRYVKGIFNFYKSIEDMIFIAYVLSTNTLLKGWLYIKVLGFTI